MNKDLKKIIEENTISWDEFTKDFTKKDWQIVEAEIKYYDMLVSLRKARKKLGLTQAELAKKANLPRTTITKVESGNYNPTIQTLVNIASAMDKKLQINLV